MEKLKNFKEYLNSNFYKWFGKSKIVDSKGNPMICYHGTNQKFDTFNLDNFGSANDEGFYGKGFYFTFGNGDISKSEAGYYGNSVLGVYLKVENPFVFENLLKYNGYRILTMHLRGFVFCYNLAIKFPELANKIHISKTTWNGDEGEVSNIPISILPKLVEKYKKDLTIIDINGNDGNKYKSGYVKSEVIEFDSTKSGGKKGSFVDYDTLNNWVYQTNKEELEIGLIYEAIEKYDFISVDYHPEGLMTRNSEITDTIKKNGYDGIVQSMDGDEVVVFDSNQIKSATSNNGNFSLKSNNINESINNIKTKLLNDDGNPKIVYHGTNSNFSGFSKEKFNTNEPKGDYIGEGFYFTNSKETAKKYGSNIVRANLIMFNPIIINSEDDIEELKEKFGGVVEYYKLSKQDPSSIRKQLQEEGYDGLIDNLYNQYAVFEPNQINIIR